MDKKIIISALLGVVIGVAGVFLVHEAKHVFKGAEGKRYAQNAHQMHGAKQVMRLIRSFSRK
jgi:hypothetical protein